ncbi:MPN domain-containing protein [Chionoecetes opilio]|uniref:MPN domain-containing protein n=1 Tax=Chionoecetes opilio TaxID=41210 RepID=A0A8J5CGV2_CHIOP|nr:MPN domain-containing protein [Chionoecetes opilio]
MRDIDSQLEYELKMKGSNDASYTPCIGIIVVTPYVRGGGQGTTASGFWVMPPPEHKPQEYGRPMSIQFTIIQDAFIPKETLYHVRDTVKYYKDLPDAIVFSDIFQDRCSYWDKFKTAIRLCVPKDHYAPLVDYLAKLLELKNYTPEPVAPPGKTKSSVPAPKHTQQETSETSTTVAASSTPTSPLRPPTSLNLKLSGDLGPSIDRASPPVIDVSPDEPKPPPGMASPSPPQHVETPIAKVERTASSHVELQRHELFKSKELPQQELKSPPDHHHHHHHHSSRGSPPQYKPFLELYSEHKQDAAPHQSFSQDHHQHHHQDHKHHNTNSKVRINTNRNMISLSIRTHLLTNQLSINTRASTNHTNNYNNNTNTSINHTFISNHHNNNNKNRTSISTINNNNNTNTTNNNNNSSIQSHHNTYNNSPIINTSQTMNTNRTVIRVTRRG